MTWREFFVGKLFKGVVLGLVALAVLLFVFKAGMIVGFYKAGFSSRWKENYDRNFGGPRTMGMMRGLNDRDVMRAHGVFGQVLKIDETALVIKDRDGAEKIVLVEKRNPTDINKQRTISINGLTGGIRVQ